MAKKESVQKRLQKVRPPRVQLTYDVEKGDAIEQKELPFVVGVVADLSGQSEVQQPKLRDRKFVNIDRDNFDDVMAAVEPRAAFQVQNTLTEEGGKFGVDLKFRSLEDFQPRSRGEPGRAAAPVAGGPLQAGRPAQQDGRQRQARRPAVGSPEEHRKR